ncbi:TPA: hypothetical protein ACPE5I_001725 [Staphylococcus aureus]|uniref:Nitrogen regulation protein NIFR3 n=4 Tax=Staphylococcus aureus TaxID=1280 RepID=A0AAP7YSC3_STAAU|nr:hypothetical protein [Staphylococcus aureus]EPZ07035.1 nitrogen regulation protein NIFR3 [Staphylococcus aureus S130]EZT67020.1 hypothetical protein U885_01208 [Staphylococcus aureus 81629]EZT83942.1 hypothetical protein U954_01152 [Staphylococcus aureus 1484-9]EZU02109.1 hypothetical protein U909_01626 [Staphylococcus aureus 09-00736]EZU10713.1 hypothetical protein U904_01191 [Staphylococcus aureus 08-01059]EZU44421.1 hypothetical protein U978_02162 [Staphylococcus aureus 1110601704]EZU8
MPNLIEMIVFNVFTNWRGPNTEVDEKSAYNNVQVGERDPNIENFKKKFYRQCKLAGPQHREFQKEILQTMQVGEQRNTFYENIISIPLLRITT